MCVCADRKIDWNFLFLFVIPEITEGADAQRLESAQGVGIRRRDFVRAVQSVPAQWPALYRIAAQIPQVTDARDGSSKRWRCHRATSGGGNTAIKVLQTKRLTYLSISPAMKVPADR